MLISKLINLQNQVSSSMKKIRQFENAEVNRKEKMINKQSKEMNEKECMLNNHNVKAFERIIDWTHYDTLSSITNIFFKNVFSGRFFIISLLRWICIVKFSSNLVSFKASFNNCWSNNLKIILSSFLY